MEIHRIALYLAGKFPPYYQAPYDKLELIEHIRKSSPKGFSDDFFKIIDSQDFYSMCLNRVGKADPDGLIKIINELSIPTDAGGLIKKTKLKKSIGFLTPFDDNKLIKENLVKDLLPKGWSFKSFDINPLNTEGFLFNQIQNFLEEHDFYIVDLRPKQSSEEKYNVNVLLELGYILGKETPYILIRDENLTIPSDLQGIAYVTEKKFKASEGGNGKDHFDEFKIELEVALNKAINEFEK